MDHTGCPPLRQRGIWGDLPTLVCVHGVLPCAQNRPLLQSGYFFKIGASYSSVEEGELLRILVDVPHRSKT